MKVRPYSCQEAGQLWNSYADVHTRHPPVFYLSLNLSSSAVSFFFFLWLLLLYYLLSLTRARVGNVFARGKATSVILLETVFESCSIASRSDVNERGEKDIAGAFAVSKGDREQRNLESGTQSGSRRVYLSIILIYKTQNRQKINKKDTTRWTEEFNSLRTTHSIGIWYRVTSMNCRVMCLSERCRQLCSQERGYGPPGFELLQGANYGVINAE